MQFKVEISKIGAIGLIFSEMSSPEKVKSEKELNQKVRKSESQKVRKSESQKVRKSDRQKDRKSAVLPTSLMSFFSNTIMYQLKNN